MSTAVQVARAREGPPLPGVLGFAAAILSSLKFAVWIALMLAIACILGTILPQNEDPQNYLKMMGPATFRWILWAGLTDVFHTWWFTGLMTLLNLSLFVCTTRKFVNAWPWAYRLVPSDPETRRRRGHMWGNWVLHISLITVCGGGLAGSILGWKEFVRVPEGSSAPFPHKTWTILCEKFHVDMYPRGDKPRQFRSNLTVLDGSGPLVSKQIEVNKPWLLGDVRIYQASYGSEPRFALDVADKKTGKTRRIALKTGDTAEVSPSLSVRADEFFPDFRIQGEGEARQIVNVSDKPNNPALRVTVLRNGAPAFEDWVFRHPTLAAFSGQHASDVSYRWEAIEEESWTGLQIVHDPGFRFVYLGVMGIMLGLLMMFYLFPRQRLTNA